MYDDYSYPPVKPYRREGDLGITVIVIVIVDLLVTATLICALFCPSYHYTTIAFFTGASVSFNVSLWSVEVTGNASGFIGRFQPKMVTKFITNLINSLNNRSLAEFQTFACYIDAVFAQTIPNGCNSIIVLRVASYILASCLVIAALLVFSGAFSLIVFWFNRRTLLSRRLAYFLHIIPGFVVIMGLAIYLIIGGINLDFSITIPVIVADVNPIDLSSGFFATAGAGILCIAVPAFMYFLLPEELCLDSAKHFELEEAREDDALIDALQYERRQHFGLQQQYGMYNRPLMQ